MLVESIIITVKVVLEAVIIVRTFVIIPIENIIATVLKILMCIAFVKAKHFAVTKSLLQKIGKILPLQKFNLN